MEKSNSVKDELYNRAQAVATLESRLQLWQMTNTPTDPVKRAELDIEGRDIKRKLAVARALYELELRQH